MSIAQERSEAGFALREMNAEIRRLRKINAQLLDAMRSAVQELGVPQPGYPAPVANAVRILQSATTAATGND